MSGPTRIGDDLVQFTLRLIQDAVNSGTPVHWERRAKDFDDAISRPGDYPGRRSAAERHAADEQNRMIAENCRNHARLLREKVGKDTEVSNEITEFFHDETD